MAKLVKIEKDDLNHFLSSPHHHAQYCEELEAGNILFFSSCPFEFPQDELEFLLSQKQSGASNRKNIAYKPQTDKITNFVKSSDEQAERLHEIMRKYSKRVSTFLSELLSPYASKWRLDYASFRPFQEEGRKLRTRARNDLLHVDAFPSRPMHGKRILRFFTNINPKESRCWTTSDPFAELATAFGGKEGLPFPQGVDGSLLERLLCLSKSWVRKMGVPLVLRSPYDSFMLNLHNFLKENEEFQKNCRKDYWEFPPNSCWIVFTDQVSHAATAGQYALEQTILVPKEALIHPEASPVGVLEKLSGRRMIQSAF